MGMTPDQHRAAAEAHIGRVDRLLARLAAIPPRRHRTRGSLTDEAHTRCLAAWVHLRAADTRLRDRADQLQADLDDACEAAADAAEQRVAADYLHTQAVAEQTRLAEKLADANQRLAGIAAFDPGGAGKYRQTAADVQTPQGWGDSLPTPVSTAHRGTQTAAGIRDERLVAQLRPAGHVPFIRTETPATTETGHR
jgi:hypothetical protein